MKFMSPACLARVALIPGVTGKSTRLASFVSLFASLLLTLCPAFAAPQLLPGVYGYGADRAINSAGFGTNAVIIYVDPSLPDNNSVAHAGTAADPTWLRDAVTKTIPGDPPRVIVFPKSGVVHLTQTLTVNKPFTTIAGQTAPSPGVALHDAGMSVSASNVLIQHLRVRPGDAWSNVTTGNRDGVAVSTDPNVSPGSLSNVVIDHCTFMWSLDEAVSTWYNWDNVTFNKCLIAEPLHVSIHLDEGMFDLDPLPPAPGNDHVKNEPWPAEMLTTPATTPPVLTGFSSVSTQNTAGIGGSYQRVDSDSDTDSIEYTVPLVPYSKDRIAKHVCIVGITGPDRAKFRITVFEPGNPTALYNNTSEIFDLYTDSNSPVSSKNCITQQNFLSGSGFTIPKDITSVKVRLTVAGRNAGNTTGWKLGIDQISITDGHGLGPLAAYGGTGDGKFTMIGCIIQHIVARGPWVSSKQFYYANNVSYNRRQNFLHFGHPDHLDVPIHAAVLGNTFIEGQDVYPLASLASPITNSYIPANQQPPSQLYMPTTSNSYDPGDHVTPPPMVQTILTPPANGGTYGVTSDPTVKIHGLAGVTALPPASAYEAALLTAGARPADRDPRELQLISDLANGAAVHAIASRPGAIKHTVASAGGFPNSYYVVNNASWTLPLNPNLDDNTAGYPAGNGYTNLEEWLHGLSRGVESAIDAPTPKFDDFQDGNADGWTPDGGTWVMTTLVNGAVVYEQSDNLQLSVRSALHGTNWTDQLVEADANMINFSGTNRFMGVVARYRDPANYYYFILRTNNTWELKRLVDNVSLTLATGAVTVNTGTWYTLSLEVIGSTLKAYLNGVLLGSATDTSHPSGRAALLQNYARVQFDNVVADPNPGAVNAPLWLTATVAASPNNINTINLAWANVANETGYKVERKKGVSGLWSQIGTTGLDVTTFADNTCGAGTQYFYRVRATNAGGDSVYSAEANATTAEVTSGRQAHWKFDENTGTSTADASGNGNTGTLATLPTPGSQGPTWATGKIGSALTFDASDDVVTAGNGTSLNYIALPAITITAWIKVNTLMGEGGNPGRIIHKGTGTLPTAGWQFVTQGTNQIAFAVDYGTTDLNHVSANNAISLGAWRHVAVTWTGSPLATDVKLYVDGVETGYTTATNGGASRVNDTNSIVHLGNDNSGARTFDGALDDVRIYNRVLSTTELTAIRNAGL